jgi:hypothetical protein
MTDKVSSVASVRPKGISTTGSNDFSFSIGKDKGSGHVIFIRMPKGVTTSSVSTMTVQRRMDDLPMVEESWMLEANAIFTFNNNPLLKRMLAGKLLKVRFTSGGRPPLTLEASFSKS